MKRLLIVTPSFLPNTAADMHRARLLAPRALENGWKVEILCVDSRDNSSPKDDALLGKFPADIPIHRVRAPGQVWHRWFGQNNLFRRALAPLRMGGERLLDERPYDLVYFSSTAFNTFTLGPIWKRRYGVPYVLDYQDPWINDYYRRTGRKPPGGRLRHGMSQMMARHAEPVAVRDAAGLTAVSPGYLEQLRARYGEVPPALVLPFPSEGFGPPEEYGEPVSGMWTSVGRGGEDLQPAAKALFEAMVRARSLGNAQLDRVHVRFVGTSYAPDGKGERTIEPIARSAGWNQVEEQTNRVSLIEARRLQLESERLVALFSDDSAYQPSKLAGLMRSGRPLLLVAPKGHPLHTQVSGIAGVTTLAFGPEGVSGDLSSKDLRWTDGPVWPQFFLDNTDERLNARQLFDFLAECASR
ncbi:MAG: glycosyltransferase [Ahniella sp.]|nr:glycosyltransferase [Ahniella sp.]